MSNHPIFRTHPIPRRDTIREWLLIAAAYVIFFGPAYLVFTFYL